MTVAQEVTVAQVQDCLEKLTKNLYKQEIERVRLFLFYMQNYAKDSTLTKQPQIVVSLTAHILVIKLVSDLFREEKPDHANCCKQIAIELEQAFGWPVIVQRQNLSDEILDHEISILKMLLTKAQEHNNTGHQGMITDYISMFEIRREMNTCFTWLKMN